MIELKSQIVNDEYTNYIYESFDIQDQEKTKVLIENNINIESLEDWNVGVIYGGSGSGKTTLLNDLGSIKDVEFDNDKALISCFDFLEPAEACQLLSNMGLASVPTWLRPYNKLSNGEQYRAKLAHIVGSSKKEEISLIDEYTSVVDRDVARAMSFALQKYVRKHNKKVILSSCHFDIMEWLTPDWIYSPYNAYVEKRRYLRRRPRIDLEIFRCRYDAWRIFKPYHYLTGSINKASKCFIATWNDKPVGFIAVLPFPNGSFKNAFRGHRTVVLPDYQGMGLGHALTTYIASLYKALGKTYYVRTANPALSNKRRSSEDWQECGNSGVDRRGQTMFSDGAKSYRIAYSFKYVGDESNDSTNVITFDSKIYENVSKHQIKLF